jgi:hypothetical protein
MFLGKNFGPSIWSEVHSLRMQHDFPYNICVKNEFYEGCSNNNFNSETWVASKVHNSCNKDLIVKLGSFGHNSLKYCAYFSSPWPCAIIPVRIMGNYPRLDIILLHICNLGSASFACSILSWIMHRNSSFDPTNSILQIWYKLLHDSWCRIYFLYFASYFKASLLFFPNLDIKSFKDSQIMHFLKHKPPFSHIDIEMVSFLQPTHVNTSNV